MSDLFEIERRPHRPPRTLLLAMVPILGIFVAAIAFLWRDRGALPGFRPTLVDVGVAEVTREHKGVRLAGTAHYLGIRQTVSSGPDRYVFALFPTGDTESRSIHVLVRTTREPEELADYANITVEGLARAPSYEIPVTTIEAIRKRGYTLEQDAVLIEELVD
jgi:hypothetical protein